MAESRRGPRLVTIALPQRGQLKVYANARVAAALLGLMEDMSLYSGVRFGQVIEAAYEQGLRDGHREVFEELERLKENPALRHRNPGRPPVTKKRATKKRATKKRATKKRAPKKQAPKKQAPKKQATKKRAQRQTPLE